MTSGPAARAGPVHIRYRKILGQNVFRLRVARQLTQRELAALTGLSIDWISVIERGRVNPTIDVVIDFALALKVAPGELLMTAHDK